MRAIASTPRSGREPCAANPSVSISKSTNPLCATASRSSVGSVTITASGRLLEATAALPTLANSSSATAETITSPRSASESARSAASNDAARLAFMSYAPRP